MKSILVIISHPDDEIIWAGNTLTFLQQQDWLVYIVCLSGNDPNTVRYREFHEICRKLHWQGVIVGKPMQLAHASLGHWAELVNQAFSILKWRKPTLVLTHAPYGDEYNHPHHTWCYQNTFQWAKKNKYSFSFFSFIKLPLLHNNKLKNLHKCYNVILSEFSYCYSSLYFLINRLPSVPNYNDLFRCPKYFLQINFETNTKKIDFEIYESVGVDKHINNYSSFHLNFENIYFFDVKGVQSMLTLFKESNNPNIFAGYEHIFIRVLRKIEKWLLR